MERQRILNTRNQLVGYIEHMADGRLRALNSRFQVVGYYDPRTNRTLNSRFSAIAVGNVIGSLLTGRDSV
jgi:hypothetical protein